MSIQSQLEAIAKRSTEKVEKVIRVSVFEVGNRIVIRSPFKTGLFISRWLTGINAIDNRGEGQINQVASDFKIGDTLYFVNSLPYADRLEKGWSDLARNGMVKLSAAEFDAIAEAAIRQFGD